jgi:hypothetical protein
MYEVKRAGKDGVRVAENAVDDVAI